MEMIGELEADVLRVLKEKEIASVSDVHSELQRSRQIAYTTVSTTLDRLYGKKLVERRAIRGPGGTKYLFYLGRNERAKIQMVEEAFDRLTKAFGETAYSALYKKLETLQDDQFVRLKKQVDAVRRKKGT
ncbi:MAG: BlaI/MecI/CopY family transcriptional regulator [Nitrososphaerales archaeon]